MFLVFTIFNHTAGNILSLFAGVDYSAKYAMVDYRVKQLAYVCIRAVHHNRFVTCAPSVEYYIDLNFVSHFLICNYLFCKLVMPIMSEQGFSSLMHFFVI